MLAQKKRMVPSEWSHPPSRRTNFGLPKCTETSSAYDTAREHAAEDLLFKDPEENIGSSNVGTDNDPVVNLKEIISVSDVATVAVSSNVRSNSNNTPRKAKLRLLLKNKHARLSRLEHKLLKLSNRVNGTADMDDIIKRASKYLPAVPLQFFTSQLKMSRRKNKGLRWTDDDKLLALSIFYHGRKCYRFLSNIFKLPTFRSLRKWMQKFVIQPGFSDNILNVLKKKIESKDDKLAVLCFDEISLKCGLKYNRSTDCISGLEDFGPNLGCSKRIANHALVFMVKGLKCKWKQAFGYFFACDTVRAEILESLLLEAVQKLFDIGILVKAIVCDQGSSNRSLFTRLNISPERPFIRVNGHHVYVLYDPPHLVKSIRNNFVKYDFECDEGLASFQHVQQFFENDSKLPVRMCPKLGPKHVELTNFSKMRVCLATQLLSHSTAAALMTYISIGALPDCARATVSFIDRFDRLFDCFNSVQQHCILKPHKGAIAVGTVHAQFLSECSGWLQRVKVCNNGNEIHCINGWQITISAVISLWTELRSHYGYSYLLTSRLNQDCLENFFAVIRQSSGCCDNPEPLQFQAAVKQSMINLLLKPPKSSNCAYEADPLLSTLRDLPNLTCSEDFQNASIDNSSTVATGVFNQSYCDIDLNSIPLDNTLHYIAGYILYKLKLDTHICANAPSCQIKMELIKPELSTTYQLLSYWKALYAKGGMFGGLRVPTESFLTAIKHFELIFLSNFDTYSHVRGIRQMLSNRIFERYPNTDHPQIMCNDTLVQVVNMYVSIRLHAAVKFITRTLNKPVAKGTSKAVRKDRKLMKLMHQ